MLCPKCQKEIADDSFVCPSCNAFTALISPRKNWLVTALLCFFLGGFGVHRFYTGYTTYGIIMLVLCFALCGISWLWALIDLIMILTNSYKDVNGLPLTNYLLGGQNQ